MKAEPHELPLPKRRLSYLAVVLSIVITMVDQSATNIMLPTLAQDFGSGNSNSVLIVNLYQLTLIVGLVPLARLGEKIGYRRVYLTGLAGMILCWIACSLTQNIYQLAFVRALQGLASSGIMSVHLALVRHIVPPRIFGRAVGFNATVVAIGSTTGPLIAGLFISYASWRWMFLACVPVALFSLILGLRYLPWNRTSDKPFDTAGASLSALTFGFVILSVVALVQKLPVWQVLAFALTSVIACLVLVRRERRAVDPMLPIDLLRDPLISLTLATSVLAFTTQMLVFIIMPFQLQSELGFSVVEAGVIFMPWPIAHATSGVMSGFFSDRYRPSVLSGAGLVMLSSGIVSLALLEPEVTVSDVAWRMALCGFGFGFFQVPNNKTIMAGVPLHLSGRTSSAIGTARLLGQSFGAALAAIGLTMADATPLLWLASAIALVATLIGVLRLAPVLRPPE
ncbi:MAG: MFS transporter [Rhizobiaceae bacterium]|nr:MFS transporter [Rhizobiaceae bacterium]